MTRSEVGRAEEEDAQPEEPEGVEQQVDAPDQLVQRRGRVRRAGGEGEKARQPGHVEEAENEGEPLDARDIAVALGGEGGAAGFALAVPRRF